MKLRNGHSVAGRALIVCAGFLPYLTQSSPVYVSANSNSCVLKLAYVMLRMLG